MSKIIKVFTTYGFPAVIRENGIGNLCGYIGVPKDTDYEGVDVHGGITFTGELSYENTEHLSTQELEILKTCSYWIGFDCAHFMDAQDPKWVEANPKLAYSHGGTYKDVNYVTAECERLASQL